MLKGTAMQRPVPAPAHGNRRQMTPHIHCNPQPPSLPTQKKITCHLEPCPRAPLGWQSRRGSPQGTDEPGALEHPHVNKDRDVTSQVQEECDLRRQFVLVEVSQKGQEEHRHQVTLLAWRDTSHCLDDVQRPSMLVGGRWFQPGAEWHPDWPSTTPM